MPKDAIPLQLAAQGQLKDIGVEKACHASHCLLACSFILRYLAVRSRELVVSLPTA